MYLGVDGGGTKTALCPVDDGGHVAAQPQAPSCYYFAEGIDFVGRVLQEGIDEIPPDVSWISVRRKRFQSPTPAVYSVYAPSSTASKRPSRIFTTGTSCASPCIRLLSGRRSTRPDSRANLWTPRRSANYKRHNKSQAPRQGESR
jgi:hypothetical protein